MVLFVKMAVKLKVTDMELILRTVILKYLASEAVTYDDIDRFSHTIIIYS